MSTVAARSKFRDTCHHWEFHAAVEFDGSILFFFFSLVSFHDHWSMSSYWPRPIKDVLLNFFKRQFLYIRMVFHFAAVRTIFPLSVRFELYIPLSSVPDNHFLILF